MHTEYICTCHEYSMLLCGMCRWLVLCVRFCCLWGCLLYLNYAIRMSCCGARHLQWYISCAFCRPPWWMIPGWHAVLPAHCWLLLSQTTVCARWGNMLLLLHKCTLRWNVVKISVVRPPSSLCRVATYCLTSTNQQRHIASFPELHPKFKLVLEQPFMRWCRCCINIYSLGGCSILHKIAWWSMVHQWHPTERLKPLV